MSTLLTMLNDLRVMLSEEQITSVSSTDTYTQALIRLINRSVADVLESRVWSFDKRFDGYIRTYESFSGTDITCTGGSDPIQVEYDSTVDTALIANDYELRFRLKDDTDLPGTSYRILYGDNTTSAPDFSFWLEPTYAGGDLAGSTSSDFEIYTRDIVLPSTVRKVLSVRDEEQPLQLYFSEDEIFEDRAWPRHSDQGGDIQCIVIGGTSTASYDSDTDSSGTTGMRMRIYPPPSDSHFLYYTYVYRHAQMTAATDTLTGVPDNVIRLIIDRAFYYCLATNIESDPDRASRVEKQWRTDLVLVGAEDKTAPNRRRIMRPFGASIGRHPNARWSSKEVPSP